MTQYYEFTTTVLRQTDMRLHTVLAQNLLKTCREIQLSRISIFPYCHRLLEIKYDAGVTIAIERFVAVDTATMLFLDMSLVNTVSLQQSCDIVGSLDTQAFVDLRRTRLAVGSTNDSGMKAIFLDDFCHLLDVDELCVFCQLMGSNLKEEIDRCANVLLARLQNVQVLVGGDGG